MKLSISKISKYHVLLVLATVVIRLPYLLAKYTLGVDDGIYALSAKHVANGKTPFEEVFSSQGGWFLEIISIPMRIFGDSHFASRLIPLISGIVIAIISFEIAKRFINQNVAFFCALAITFSGTLIRTTSAITSDGLMVAFSLLCILYAFKLVENESTKNSLFLGMYLGLGCSVKSIFMIPTIIFLIYITSSVKIKKRLIALSLSLAIFVVPFLLFGFDDVWTQSVGYHLGKDSPLDLAENLEKMATAFSSLDIFLVGVTVIAIAIFVTNLIRKKTSGVPEIREVKSILLLATTSFVLLLIQAPLFRNHLVILLPALGILLFYFLEPYLNKKYPTIALTIMFLISTTFTAITLLNDKQFELNKNPETYRSVITSAKSEKSAVMITNDVGLAFDAGMEIPVGLEDTSKYRFKSKDPQLKIDSKTFASYLVGKNACAVVLNKTEKDRLFFIEESLMLDDGWSRTYDDSDYLVWFNSKDCQPASDS